MEMLCPLLSIIIPAFNTERYIVKCINSILKQTFSDFELIIIDDGSSDSTSKICDDFSMLDERVSVIHQENIGHIATRKKATHMARGKYIAFVDSDDWVDNYMYEKMVNIAEKENCDIVIAGYIEEYINGKYNYYYPNFKSGKYNKEDIDRYIMPHLIMENKIFKFGINPALWNKIFKKEILQRHIDEIDNTIKVGEDAALFYSTFMEAQNCYVCDNNFLPYHYRVFNGSMSQSYNYGFEGQNKILISYLYGIALKKKATCLNSLGLYELYMTYLMLRNIGLMRENLYCKLKLAPVCIDYMNNLQIFNNIDDRYIRLLEFNTIFHRLFFLLMKQKMYKMLYCIFLIKSYICH